MKNNRDLKLWAVLLWLVIWQIVASVLNQELFLVSPIKAVARFVELAMTGEFWFGVSYSLVKILGGFLVAFVLGVLLGAAASKHQKLREFLAPLNITIKSVPVASFVILALICFSSEYLAVLISALIVFPIVYTSTLSGVENTDQKLLEMARVYGVEQGKVRRYIFAPEIYKYLRPACQTAIGMAWKAGIAAEVIGVPKGSMGSKIQQAKVYLETPDLIAWTLGVILLSLATEKLFVFIMDRILAGIKTSPANHNEVLVTTGGNDEVGATAKNTIEESINSFAIELKNIEKKYGDEKVLSGFNLSIKDGETVAVMAPSGEGKTTLLRIIAGLEEIDSGEVLYNGIKRKSANDSFDIPFLFQEDRLLEYMDGAGNISLFSKASNSRIVEAAKSLELEDVFGKPTSDYSGGMKRRTALIRTMLSDGNPVLLDEPFKGLDEEIKKKAAEFVVKEKRGRTLIMVTHDPDEVGLIGAEKVVYINSPLT